MNLKDAPKTNSRTKQAGFTLIELLIAIAISAVIAVLGYQSIQQVTSVKSHTDDRLAQFDELQRLVWWLEQDVVQMTPRPILDELGDTLPALKTELGGRVEWSRIADYASPQQQGGLLRVGYLLEDEKLYRLVWPVMDRVPNTEVKRTLMLDQVLSFELRWFNASNKWQDEWPSFEQSSQELPRLIEFLIEVEGLGKVRRLFSGVEGLPNLSSKDE